MYSYGHNSFTNNNNNNNYTNHIKDQMLAYRQSGKQAGKAYLGPLFTLVAAPPSNAAKKKSKI